jgi:hypothetical protein
VRWEGGIDSFPDLLGGFRGIFLRGPSGEAVELCEVEKRKQEVS